MSEGGVRTIYGEGIAMACSNSDGRVPDADSGSTWSNPAKISRKVRELAHRSHKLLNERSSPHLPVREVEESRREESRELRNQVAKLHKSIHARRLGVLVPWIDALRRQLEERLCGEEKELER
jgi:hypothetical protein